METQTASTKKIGVNYGLILGLISVAFSVVIWVLGMSAERPWWTSALSVAIMVALIVYGLKAFKAANAGFMSLGEALKTGLTISLISGLIGALFMYLFVTVIEPDFIGQILEQTERQMYEQNPNITDEQAEMGLKMTEKFTTPWMMSLFGLIGTLFFGFIISLIAGLAMKNNKPEHLQ
ncbi:DUF4199 domain-containing protein [Cochleicola gelatinilyticus]|uniref:DUF4199 domain-containing protein n=1 Tax=Cochleicola gelatinilyticus TaxID=1763537 RepID=A0A167H4C3_9FLAO|nr:DUF4199 domain-containing protein [Cochleicola gelatinilyticus]OAB78202.1 hypothetical protein ULVI_12045 [Cochleicola gelatinilyticus]